MNIKEEYLTFFSIIWGQSLSRRQNIPNVNKWGWVKTSGSLQPKWMTIAEASKSCIELIKCSCTKGCRNRCKCRRFDLVCTELCACNGECE